MVGDIIMINEALSYWGFTASDILETLYMQLYKTIDLVVERG